MDFAVVRLAGKQFLVSPGQRIVVDAHLGEPDAKLTLDEVLLENQNDTLKIGKPLLSGGKVEAKVVSKGRGEKIYVSKFKAKSRYRRTIGFRPNQTILEILSLAGTASTKVSESASTKPAKKTPNKKARS